MKIRTLTTLTAALAASAFTVAGCDVDVDAPELPEVSVEGGDTGAVDVTMPEVDLPEIEITGGDVTIPEEGDTDAGETELEQAIETDTEM